MVRRDVAERKIARASSWVDDAEELLSGARNVESRDRSRLDLACFYLMLSIQECVDLAAHACADAGWSPPEAAAHAFDVLAEHEVIPPDLADAMHGAVGLRNRIAHGYAAVDHRRLLQEAGEGIPALRRYLASIAALAGI